VAGEHCEVTGTSDQRCDGGGRVVVLYNSSRVWRRSDCRVSASSRAWRISPCPSSQSPRRCRRWPCTCNHHHDYLVRPHDAAGQCAVLLTHVVGAMAELILRRCADEEEHLPVSVNGRFSITIERNEPCGAAVLHLLVRLPIGRD